MKKAVIITTALVMIASPALAYDPALAAVVELNEYAKLTGAAQITVEPVTVQDGDSTQYTYTVSDDLQITLTIKNEKVRSFSCLCKTEALAGEFMSQAADGCYLLAGYDPDLMKTVYLDFLNARAGNETDKRMFSSIGIVFRLFKSNGQYAFVIAR